MTNRQDSEFSRALPGSIARRILTDRARKRTINRDSTGKSRYRPPQKGHLQILFMTVEIRLESGEVQIFSGNRVYVQLAPDQCLIGETGDHSLAHFYNYEEVLITE